MVQEYLYLVYATMNTKNGFYAMPIIAVYIPTQPSRCGGNAKCLSKMNPTNSDRTSRFDQQVAEHLCRVQSTLSAPSLSLLSTHLAKSCTVYSSTSPSEVFVLASLGVLG